MSPFTSILAQVMHHHLLLGMLEPPGSPGQTLDHLLLLHLATWAFTTPFTPFTAGSKNTSPPVLSVV